MTKLDQARSDLGASVDRLKIAIAAFDVGDAAGDAAWTGLLRNINDTYLPRGDRLRADFIATGNNDSAARAAIVYAEIGDALAEGINDRASVAVSAYMRQLAVEIGTNVGQFVDEVGQVAAEAVVGAVAGVARGSGWGTLLLAAAVLYFYFRPRLA